METQDAETQNAEPQNAETQNAEPQNAETQNAKAWRHDRRRAEAVALSTKEHTKTRDRREHRASYGDW